MGKKELVCVISMIFLLIVKGKLIKYIGEILKYLN